MKKSKIRRFLKIAARAKAVHHQIVRLERDWEEIKKPVQRFQPVSLDTELMDAAFALEQLSRDSFFFAKEASK